MATVVVETTNVYQQRIDALRRTKVEHTEQKRRQRGYYDIDDHGFIPWPEPIDFKPLANHPDGRCYGPKAVGENFRAWLQVHPVYIHPASALAGCWIGFTPGMPGWRPEDRPAHLTPIHREYNIILTGIGGMNHLGPDMRIGLELGWGGLLRKIRHFRAVNQPPAGSEMADFYDGEEAFVLGVQDWIRKHADKARQMAAAESDPATRDNLLAIAEMNDWLVDGAPRTFREACQFLAWFQSLDRMYAAGGAMGQLDEWLRPFYEDDVAAGRLVDDDEAVWHLASLLFNDTHYSQISGPTPDGARDLTSRVSFLILEAVHRLKIPANLAVRVHDKLDPDLLRKAVRYLFEDGTGASYSCSGGLDQGYARNGVPIQLARMRAKVGCNWTALPGIEYCLQDVTRITFVSPFLHAFNDVTGTRLNGSAPPAPGAPVAFAGPAEPAPAYATDADRLDALWGRFEHHLAVCVDAIKQGIDWHLEHHARNAPEIVLNLFCHGPIERGLDAAAGGLDLYHMSMDGLGLATTADSFAAIEQRVVNEQRLAWDELARVLESNYAGPEGERARLMLKNIARFGSGGSRADWWAKRIADSFTRMVKESPTPRSRINVVPGLFSHGDIGMQGRNLAATPNGRKAGEGISHSADPDPGFMLGGVSAPTAKANAVAAVQPGWGNSAPLQIDFDMQLARDMGGTEAIEAYIKAHNAMGGTLININVISKEKVLEAHADPEKHPDLVVRVTGYSAFFKMLSPEYRQQIVDRLLAEG